MDGPLPNPPELACVSRHFPPRPSRVWHGAGDEGREIGIDVAGFFFYAFLYNSQAAIADIYCKGAQYHD